MDIFSRITGWFRKDGSAAGSRSGGKSDLQKNMEKALQMKQEAGPQANIPEHQTAHEGSIHEVQVNRTDTAVGKEPTYTPNLKRSRVARSGDAA